MALSLHSGQALDPSFSTVLQHLRNLVGQGFGIQLCLTGYPTTIHLFGTDDKSFKLHLKV